MKGALKAFIITSIICICLGTVIAVGAVAAGGWREVVKLARRGEFNIVWHHNDGEFQERLEWYLEDWDDEGYISDWEDSWDEFGEDWREALDDTQTEINEEMSQLEDNIKENVSEALDSIEEGVREYERYGGNESAKIIAGRDEVSGLDIDISGGALYFVPSPDDKIRVLCSTQKVKYSCYQEDGVFIFKDKENSHLHGYNNRKIFIGIPQDMKWEEADIDLGAGLFAAEYLNAGSLDIEAGAGMTVIRRLNAGDIRMRVGAGEVLVGNGTVNEARINVDMGYAYFGGLIQGNLDVDCDMGAVELILNDSSKAHNYRASADAGTIKIDGEPEFGLGARRTLDNGADSNFDLKCGMGMISLYFKE